MSPEEWYATIGHQIRIRRQGRYRSMRAAAEAAHISEATWRHVETGKRMIEGAAHAPNPGADAKAAICRAIEWPTDRIDRLQNGERFPSEGLFEPEELGLKPLRAGSAYSDPIPNAVHAVWAAVAAVIWQIVTQVEVHRDAQDWSAVSDDLGALTNVLEAAAQFRETAERSVPEQAIRPRDHATLDTALRQAAKALSELGRHSMAT